MGKTRRFHKKRAYKKRRTIRKQRKSRKYHGGACELKHISELSKDFSKPIIPQLGWTASKNVKKLITLYTDDTKQNIVLSGQISTTSYANNNATIETVSLCGNKKLQNITYNYGTKTTDPEAEYYTLLAVHKDGQDCVPETCK